MTSPKAVGQNAIAHTPIQSILLQIDIPSRNHLNITEGLIKMKNLFSFVLTTLSFLTLSSSALAAPQQVPITGPSIPFTFRNATLEDVDDIATVYLDAFRNADATRYVRQFADKDPEYTWTCQREAFKRVLLNPQAGGPIVVKVISVPDLSLPRKERVVSIGAWMYGYLQQESDTSLQSASFTGLNSGLFSVPMGNSIPNEGKFDCNAHLDMNMTRALHYERAINEAQNDYLLKPYGSQFTLGLLATHPEWDGNGFAARHIHWGKETLADMNQAPEHSDHRLPLTLIGTPAGYPLYISEGFQGVKNITIERLDGEGVLWCEAMKYEEKEN